MKGVFDLELGSPYGDRPAERYFLGKRKDYVALARQMVDDWIIYRESKRGGGRKGYVGAARVISVESDAGYFYANVSDFVAFDPPVELKDKTGAYRESDFGRIANPRLVGVAFQGSSVRGVSNEDFAAIVAAGLEDTLSPQGIIRYGIGPTDVEDVTLAHAEHLPGSDFVRRVELALVNRKVRETNFRRLVCRAYEDTCAVTGLRILNGGDRSEVQAAHIWPVELGGPDVVQNGVALSGTVHWLFDRHLLSVTEDYRLNVAHNRIPPELRDLFKHQMERIRLPKDRSDWPHPEFLRRRRERYSI